MAFAVGKKWKYFRALFENTSVELNQIVSFPLNHKLMRPNELEWVMFFSTWKHSREVEAEVRFKWREMIS
jgi:hypothetical protein